MLLLLRVIFVSALLMTGQAQADSSIRIGVLAIRGAEHSLEDWAPSIDAIRSALGKHHRVDVVPLDHAGMADALDKGAVDFVITNPGHYVEMELAKGISRILTLQSGEPVASTFITRADNPQLTTLSDLRGKTLAIVGREAFGGFQIGWLEMLRAGVDPIQAIRLIPVGLPMPRVLEAVLSGAADAGIVRACLLERQVASGAVAQGALRVLGEAGRSASGCALSSPIYPDWPIAKARQTPPELARQLAVALLAWQPSAGEAGWTVPLDYQPVHDLFRELKIGPYEHLRHETLTQFLWRVRHWLAAALVAMLAWLVHVARVERLVRRRTSELASTHADLVREMTARRAAEERDALHLRELDHTGRLSIVGEMASGLAHELNQPLAAIVNYADGSALRLKAGQTDAASLLLATKRIQQQAERAGTIVQQMRNFARKKVPEIKPCDINNVVSETLGLFEGMFRRANVVVDVDLAATLPTVAADKIQIQQVLLNLFQNALDAMQEGSREKRLTVATRARPDQVAVTVTDTGPGLPESERQKMFEPFFTTKPQGLGLGLSLCHSIMEAHGGGLVAEAAPPGGMTMTLHLPTQAP
jgi:two-component system sensor histidine kinase TtrS